MNENPTPILQHAMNNATREAANAVERQRAMHLLGICEIITHRAPTATHLVFDLDENQELLAHTTIEDHEGKTITGLFDHTSVEELSLEYFGAYMRHASWVTKIGKQHNTPEAHTIKVALHDIAGKNLTKLDPTAFLDTEMRLEASVFEALKHVSPGKRAPHEFEVNNSLQALSWCDGDDCEVRVTAAQKPVLAAHYTTALQRLSNTTHTSWKWTKINTDQWSYAPEGSLHL